MEKFRKKPKLAPKVKRREARYIIPRANLLTDFYFEEPPTGAIIERALPPQFRFPS